MFLCLPTKLSLNITYISTSHPITFLSCSEHSLQLLAGLLLFKFCPRPISNLSGVLFFKFQLVFCSLQLSKLTNGQLLWTSFFCQIYHVHIMFSSWNFDLSLFQWLFFPDFFLSLSSHFRYYLRSCLLKHWFSVVFFQDFVFLPLPCLYLSSSSYPRGLVELPYLPGWLSHLFFNLSFRMGFVWPNGDFYIHILS